MIERLLFFPMNMPFEEARIVIALVGTLIGVYFDVFNNRNIPNLYLYAFLAVALLSNVVFYDADVFIYAILLAAIVFFAGFLLYRTGQLGGADVFVLASITLLLPISPSYIKIPFNFPFIFSVLLFGGVAFSVFAIGFFAKRLKGRKARPNFFYLILLIPYFLFAYIFISAPFFSPAYFFIASILLLSTIFFLMFREPINESMTERVLLRKTGDEEVLAREKMGETMKKLKIGPVLGQKERKALERAAVKHIWIYSQLPPFLPFVFVGMVLALFFGDLLFPVF